MLANNLIKLRKEKNVTQEVLAEYLSVSRQTISSWESGITTPNIEQLTKLSNYYNVTVDELLNGLDNKKRSHNYILLYLILFVLAIFIFVIILKQKNDNQENEIINNEYECKMIRTYHVIDVNESNDENYFYITISEYQSEGVYTIKIPQVYAKEIIKDNNYEFTFDINQEYVNSDPNVIFDSSELINIVKTEKIGMEQKSEFVCK